MPEQILRLPKVIALIGVSRSWIYSEVACGRFPAPVALGARAVGWRRSVIVAWIEDRKPKGVRDDQ